jgi:hypothetical protein
MNPAVLPQIDVQLLEQFRERIRERSKHPFRLIATAFLRQGIVAFLLWFVLLPLVNGDRPFGSDFSNRKVLFLGLAVLVMATTSAFLAYRSTRDTLRLDPRVHQELLMADWTRWAGTGWLKRTVGMGAILTSGVGVPIGLLMAVTLSPAELPGGSRSLMALSFLGLTALWAFPMAFFIRWYVGRDYRAMTHGAHGAPGAGGGFRP